MLKPLRTNPLLDQTLRTGRRPSLRVTIVLLIALLTGAMAGRDWLIDTVPAEAHAVLLLLLWLLPLVTMAVAAASTARRLRTKSFQLVKQSPLTDRQVTWGLGLSTLYYLRVVLVLIFGALPALVDDTLVGGLAMALCLAGLHLAGSMLGTALMLRWGWQQLGVVLAITCCTLIVALLPTLTTLLSPILTPGCPSASLHPVHFHLSAMLLRQGLHGPIPAIIASVLPTLIGWIAGLPSWRGRDEGLQPRLEVLGLTLAIGSALGFWVVNISQIEAREHQSLVAIYQATGGDGWINKSGWLSDQSICSWYGVTCVCGRVTALDLLGNNLKGELPPALGQLTNLKRLYLTNNQITGLPPEIGQLTSLYELRLDYNQFSEFPPEICPLTGLLRLRLDGNQLSELPPEIGQMAGLWGLTLTENQISELSPEFGQLTNLRQLWLGANRLRELPPEIGQLTNLQRLYLYINQLSSLPPEIGQLINLQLLDLSGNQIAALPPEIGQLANLRDLRLDNNQLTTLQKEICQLPYLSVEPSELCNH